MEFERANRLSLKVLGDVLAGAKSFELDIDGQSVRCDVKLGDQPGWPTGGLRGLNEAEDGPWPKPVLVECRWDGGHCTLQVQADHWSATHRRYADHVALSVGLLERRQRLVWITLVRWLIEAEDTESINVEAAVSLVKRRGDKSETDANHLNEALKVLVARSDLPMLSQSRMQAFEIELATGQVLPSAEIAFRRLLHLALLKLEFLDRSGKAKERGTPLVNITELAGIQLDPDEQLADSEEEEEEAQTDRNYWAGGFVWGSTSKLDEFRQGLYWQIGYPATSAQPAATTTWARFRQVAPGDWLAIKGLGGKHDLVIHFVGEVLEVDQDGGRLKLEPVDVPLFKGKAPRGPGAGNWFDTLVPVTRADAIQQIFGVSAEAVEHPEPPELPPNLILYGPPGTGKTYHLRRELMPLFEHPVAGGEPLPIPADSVADLTWFEVVVVVLDQLGGRAKTPDIYQHPLVKAKHAAQGIPTLARQIVWGALQQHTVESSTTVHYKNRGGDLIFDKEEDGTWHFAAPIPDALQELVAEFRPRDAAGEIVRDHVFVTFHQAYAYEDFIEGIRPHLAETDLERAETVLRYVLEHGVFKRAVLDAIRVAGFDGTIDEFCRLSVTDRSLHLKDAPRYAVFIDEINRGNVARVFGELITLIEEDKRLGAENELIVKLPYSRTLFGVPSNLHLIGTMNTADRSVEALDTALRRRFAFQELSPRPDLLDFTIEGQVDPAAMLRTINRRLEKLYDRDHSIGHAFFLPLTDNPTLDGLKKVFERSILPLLQEYFFGDWGKIGLVLGPEFIRRRDLGPSRLADFALDDRDALDERVTYELTPVKDLTNLSFRRIYEHVPEHA